MIDFNDREKLKKIDPQDTVASTELLPKQLETAWNQVNKIEVYGEYSDIKNIVFCGMGASIYGALVLKAILKGQLPYPTETVSDYHLPDYVDKNSLVVLTSYSGTTEEVLSCAEEAKLRKAKMVALTRGGALAEFARNNHITSYIFDGKLNPAGVPRLGNGYTIIGLLGLLNKIRVITIEEKQIENAVIRLKEKFEELRQKAQNDYPMYVNKIPVIFAAEGLSGNAQILRNQFNETSKTFSSFFLVPDLNHHLMEGLQFPKDAPLKFLSLISPNYPPKITKRMGLTEDVVKKNKRDLISFVTDGATVYDDFMEVLTYGSFLTLYLALYYDQNPAINPWVDFFKEKLAK